MARISPESSAARLVAWNRTEAATGNAVDAALMARIAARDRVAMQIFYTRHHVRVRRFILRFVPDEALADHLALEVFAHVWRKAAGVAGRGPVSTWLLCVARHKTIEAARPSGADTRRRGATSVRSPIHSESTEGRLP